VLGDPILLHQPVRNLVENAVEHNMPAGWITITTGTRDHSAHLDITNSGPRLLPHDVHGLFEPFRRGRPDQTSGTGRRGVGLGLAIVKAIADGHHGHITARPGEHGGLALQIAFPEAPPGWQ
jgi:signal transduction histidine kinase